MYTLIEIFRFYLGESIFIKTNKKNKILYNFNKNRLCKIKIGERLYINVQYKRSKKRGYKNTK